MEVYVLAKASTGPQQKPSALCFYKTDGKH